MFMFKNYFWLLVGLFSITPTAHAVLVTSESDSLVLNYNTDNLYNVGTPELLGNQLVFRPNLSVSAPADMQSYYDFQSFFAVIDMASKPGFRIDGFSLTATGDSYVGDDATVRIQGSFNTVFYGASYYSGALAGNGLWSTNGSSSTALPTISLAGDIVVETQNHYSYQVIAGYNEYQNNEYGYVDYLIGYEPILDEQGNQIGENPIYESRYEIINTYVFFEPYYETFYQTSGGDFHLTNITVDFQVSEVPLPPGGGLFLGGLGMAGLSRLRLTRKR